MPAPDDFGSGPDSGNHPSLWENSAVLTKTAQQLYLHRNSLQYKIDKWEELTGLQLKELTDLTLCYQLILPDIL